MKPRTHKKVKAIQNTSEQQKRQHLQNELFKLEYLNSSLDYIMPKRNYPDSYLDLDPDLLNRISNSDVEHLSVNFIERVKYMKEPCDKDLFIKEHQQYGQFINYDLPKEYQNSIQAVENELLTERNKTLAIKRIRLKYSDAPERMSIPEVEKWERHIKRETFLTFYRNARPPHEDQSNPNTESYQAFRKLLNLPSFSRNVVLESQHKMKEQIPSESILTNRDRAEKDEKKTQVEKNDKSKKISKPSKKNEHKVEQQDQYVPKVSKKTGKIQDCIPLAEKKIQKESINPESSQHIMARRSNQLLEDRPSKNQNSEMSEQSYDVFSENKESKSMSHRNPISSELIQKRPQTKNAKEEKPQKKKSKKREHSEENGKKIDPPQRAVQPQKRSVQVKEQQGNTLKKSIGIQVQQVPEPVEHKIDTHKKQIQKQEIKEEDKEPQVPSLIEQQNERPLANELMRPEEQIHEHNRAVSEHFGQNLQSQNHLFNPRQGFLNEINSRPLNMASPSNSNVQGSLQNDISDYMELN